MAGYTPENVPSSQSVSGSSKAGTATTKATGQGTIQGGVRPPGSGMGGAMDEDEERDAVFFRLESQGYRVGLGSYTPPPPFLSFPFLSLRPSSAPAPPGVPLSLAPLLHLSLLHHQYVSFDERRLTHPRLSRAILRLPPALYRPPRRHQIPLQRSLDFTIQKTNRQFEDQSPWSLCSYRQQLPSLLEDVSGPRRSKCWHTRRSYTTGGKRNTRG